MGLCEESKVDSRTKLQHFILIFNSGGLLSMGKETFAVFHLQRAQTLNGNIASLNRNVEIILLWNERGSRSIF